MTDDSPGKKKRQAVLNEEIETYGAVRRWDPEFGAHFYMWDSMFPKSDKELPLPNYTVQETSKLFFGKGSDWLRWRYRAAPNYPDGYFVLNGIKLEPKRTEAGNRYYTLADIERMAYALVENHAIEPTQLANILQMIMIQAKMNRIIGEVETD